MLPLVLCGKKSERIKDAISVWKSVQMQQLHFLKYIDSDAQLWDFIHSVDRNRYILFVISDDISVNASSYLTLITGLRFAITNCYIVIISDDNELIFDIVNANIMPSGFLNTDYTDNRLHTVIKNIYFRYGKLRDRHVLMVLTNRQSHNLPLDSVEYIEGNKGSTKVITSSCIYTTKQSITELSAQHPNRFFQCHKSSMVNRSFIDPAKSTADRIVLTNGKAIDVSRSHIVEVRRLINEMKAVDHG